MIFFLVMPTLLGGLGNIFIPVLIGSSEVSYPRINNMSILIIPYAYSLLILSTLIEYGIGIGWTLYPPLSTTSLGLSSISISLIIYGLLLAGISSTLTIINILGTIFNIK